MIQRIKNLWSWSSIDPYVLGAETGKALAQALTGEPGEIVYPNYTKEVLEAKPDATLDELIQK